MGIEKRLKTELMAALHRGARLVIAQRPRGVAVFLPQANAHDLRPNDLQLTKDSVVRAVTDHQEYVFSNFDRHSWALNKDGQKVKIAGARSHDGLAFGDYIGFHQDCGTEFFLDNSSASITTAAIRHLYIDDVQIF